MKTKILYLLTTLLMLFTLLPSQAFAYSVLPTPDDFAGGCLAVSGADAQLDSGNIGIQHIVPTQSRITKMTLSGAYQAIFQIGVYLQKLTDGALESPILARSYIQETPAASIIPYPIVILGLDIPVTVGSEYQVTVVASSGTFYWQYAPNCDAAGHSSTSWPVTSDDDMLVYLQGYTPAPVVPVEPVTPVAPTTETGETKTTTVTTTATATEPVVSQSALAVPANFKLDRDLADQKIFSWDKNTEATLTGYVLAIYDGTTEVDRVDITEKDSDNYTLFLSEHPNLTGEKDYTATLRAKNSSESVSEATAGVVFNYNNSQETTASSDENKAWYLNIYFIASLAILLVVLATLVMIERKKHFLWKVFPKLAPRKGKKRK